MPNTATTSTPLSRTLPWQGFAIGAAAGLLSGLFGVGGGIVVVPALLSFMSMERRLAHGTSLAATVPVAAASLATYAYGDRVDWAVALCLAVGAICGTIIGTHLLQIIPKRPLTIIFIGVILFTAVRLLLGDDSGERVDLTPWLVVALVGIGLLTGILSGLLGIGGGVIMVPAMVVLLSMPPVLAKGTSVAVIFPSSIVGTLRNRANRNVDLRVGVAVGSAGVVFAVIGALISKSLSDTFSNAMFAVLLLTVAALQIRSLKTTSDTPSQPAAEVERS